jgi:tetratricopeptide (TPR) repeat protein
MDMLDISRHDPEDFIGKLIRINGATYELIELLGQGADGLVYTLRNCQTGLITFVAKVLRTLPGTAEFDATRFYFTSAAHFRQSVKMAEVMNGFSDACLENPYRFDLDSTGVETFECHGGLIQIMHLMASGKEKFHSEQSNDELVRACSAIAHGEFARAEAVLRSILEKNASHTTAMFFLAECLLAHGEPLQAASLLEEAIRLEPNEPQLYHRLAKVLLVVDSPRIACEALARGLSRWPWEYPTVYAFICTCLDCDLPDMATPALNRVLEMVPESNSFKFLDRERESSDTKKENRDRLSAEARDLVKGLLSATRVNPIELLGAATNLLRQVDDWWRIRVTRRRCMHLRPFGRIAWPFSVRDHTIDPGWDGSVERLGLGEEIGFFPSATAFEHSLDLFLLSGWPGDRNERQAAWSELLRRMYFAYEMGSDYPGVPFGFPELVRSGEYRHARGRSSTRCVHLGWGKDRGVLFVEQVETLAVDNHSGQMRFRCCASGEAYDVDLVCKDAAERERLADEIRMQSPEILVQEPQTTLTVPASNPAIAPDRRLPPIVSNESNDSGHLILAALVIAVAVSVGFGIWANNANKRGKPPPEPRVREVLDPWNPGTEAAESFLISQAFPAEERQIIAQARTLLQSSDFPAAIALLQKADKDAKWWGARLFYLGYALHHTDRNREAADVLSKFIALQDKDQVYRIVHRREARYYRALAYMALDLPREAEADLSVAIGIKPAAELHLLRAEAYVKLGRPELATRDRQCAAELEPAREVFVDGKIP